MSLCQLSCNGEFSNSYTAAATKKRKVPCYVNNVSFINDALSVSKTIDFSDNCIVVGIAEYHKCEVQSTGIKMLSRYTHGTDGVSITA